ncbi:MAG: dinitrogenase iron-molybdenum cofactor biosynthesis protein [Actinobacteria bacterium]|nr:MAG: dinitrogenase iron-molybdenum cofactor biosynthesis protein [Actinomycetota bacterium]
MKVIVSSLGPHLEDAVDERFGRAAFFVLVDTLTGAHQAIDNSRNQDALQGAGIGSAELAGEHEAEAVLTGHLGPKAFDALSKASIAGYQASGMTVADAVAAFKGGRLTRIADAGRANRGR